MKRMQANMNHKLGAPFCVSVLTAQARTWILIQLMNGKGMYSNLVHLSESESDCRFSVVQMCRKSSACDQIHSLSGFCFQFELCFLILTYFIQFSLALSYRVHQWLKRFTVVLLIHLLFPWWLLFIASSANIK